MKKRIFKKKRQISERERERKQRLLYSRGVNQAKVSRYWHCCCCNYKIVRSAWHGAYPGKKLELKVQKDLRQSHTTDSRDVVF